MSVFAGPNEVTNGLVLSLDGSNTKSYPGSGTTWTDLSGSGNTGTLTNGPTFYSGNGGGIQFDGVDDYVNITENFALTPSVLTLECVFEVLSDTNTSSGGAPTTGQYIAFRQNTRTLSFEGYAFTYDETNDLVQIVTATSGGSQSITSSTSSSVPLNTVKHVVVVLDTTQQSIYINGTLNAGPATKASGIDYNASHTLKLGRAVATGVAWDDAFNGRIYQFRIYNRVLSAAEIAQNYRAFRNRFNI